MAEVKVYTEPFETTTMHRLNVFLRDVQLTTFQQPKNNSLGVKSLLRLSIGTVYFLLYYG